MISMPMHMISFFVIPKGVHMKLDYFCSRFFWQSDGRTQVSPSQMGWYLATNIVMQIFERYTQISSSMEE
ncbi:hypothetical protein U9M48_029026 [Paspalum notatum var. saurae]|uniref:Uncharacterized protein n=1 Tax=Paspalum notatum var. saurae TaxID=547442 RepID=A0AAQ3X0R3_PASNO